MSDIIFADGVKVKKVSDTLFDLGINIENFKKFLDENSSDGWVHVNICKSKEKDAWYAKLNTWKPTKNESEEEIPY